MAKQQHAPAASTNNAEPVCLLMSKASQLHGKLVVSVLKTWLFGVIQCINVCVGGLPWSCQQTEHRAQDGPHGNRQKSAQQHVCVGILPWSCQQAE